MASGLSTVGARRARVLGAVGVKVKTRAFRCVSIRYIDTPV